MSFFNNLSTLFTASQQAKKSKKSKKSPDRSHKPKGKRKNRRKKSQAQAKTKAKKTTQASRQAQTQVKRAAQAKAKEIIVEAKDEALAIRSQAEKKARNIEKQLQDQQRFLERKLDKLDQRLSQMDRKEEHVNKEKQQAEKLRQNLNKTKKQLLEKLQEISGMTKNEARETLLEQLERKLTKEMAQLIRQKQEEAKQEADDKAREILIDSMRHGATDYVAEYTVSVVDIPTEDVKGKIIGKSGRNIHAFERYTGVDVDLDSSTTEVKLSCFDPVRREIARIALERLIKDGRIQPARIEEVVDKVRKEIDKIVFEAGKNLCHSVAVYNLPNGLVKLLGRFKYRFSYGQNMITHTLEETKIGIKLAHELKLNVNTVKLGCLLHDVGKVADDPDGSHVELGVKIAKKFKLPQPVVDCIAQHHEDKPFTSPEAMAVYIADAISGARPGARYENFEEYTKRLEQLEEIATAHKQVKNAYAIQAGRELRVLLDPQKSQDQEVTVLATKIKDQIKETMTYPGTVTVTVIRENRTQQVAK
ncbi:MAG: ribonuclease Y [Candidatus Pacebacteria bacterium]|nr:ribonuclease Y [Candidatus Paceibacterota bacterium]